MIHVEGSRISREGTEIGYIEGDYIHSRDGHKVGYFSGSHIYDVNGNKVAYIEGDELCSENGARTVSIEKVSEQVQGGVISDIMKCAIFILL